MSRPNLSTDSVAFVIVPYYADDGRKEGLLADRQALFASQHGALQSSNAISNLQFSLHASNPICTLAPAPTGLAAPSPSAHQPLEKSPPRFSSAGDEFRGSKNRPQEIGRASCRERR